MSVYINNGIVVVPWDFSELSQVAFHRVWSMVSDPSCIKIIHVAPPLTGPDNGALYTSAERQKRRQLEQRFRDQQVHEPRLARVSFDVAFGRPAFEIAKFADSHNAELIVAIARDRKGLASALFGGVDGGVAGASRCPILLISESNPRTSSDARRGLFAATWQRLIGRQIGVEAQ